MQNNPHGRRFIAGAVCPRCAQMDKTVIDPDTDQRICTHCGFTEDRPGLHEPVKTPQELSTRVSRAAARRVQTAAEPITLLTYPEENGVKPQG